jgi:hypothetical protein
MAKQVLTDKTKSDRMLIAEEVIKNALHLEELKPVAILPAFWKYDEVRFFEVIRDNDHVCFGIHERIGGGTHILIIVQPLNDILFEYEEEVKEGKKVARGRTIYPDAIFLFQEGEDGTIKAFLKPEKGQYIDLLTLPEKFEDIFSALWTEICSRVREYNLKNKRIKTDQRY